MEPISFATVTVAQMGRNGWMGGAEWVQLLWMIVWALLLAVVVLAVVRVLFVPVLDGLDFDTGDEDSDSALTTLRERYARGEIDEEEFERRASYLRGRGS